MIEQGGPRGGSYVQGFVDLDVVGRREIGLEKGADFAIFGHEMLFDNNLYLAVELVKHGDVVGFGPLQVIGNRRGDDLEHKFLYCEGDCCVQYNEYQV